MSWNGQVPTDANWQGAPQFPGSEVLYTTPDPATTATNPSIGIVDGNEIPLPTSYNTFNVSGLTATTISGTTANLTTINSTNINNAENINTATINGNPVPTSAEFWSNYQAINNVVARDGPFAAYSPTTWYDGFSFQSNVSYGTPIYQNYNTVIAGMGFNPGNRLDTFDPNVDYSGLFQSPIGATYNGIQYLLKTFGNPPPPNVIPPPNTTYWRLAEYQPTYAYLGGNLTFHAATNAWYQSIAGSTGQAPPNASYWTVYQRWTVITPPSATSNYWNISNFGDVESSTSHVSSAFASTRVEIGDSGSGVGAVLGGTLKIGADNTNSSQIKPIVQVGNASVGGSTVTIWGDLDVKEDLTVTQNLTVTGDATVNGNTFTVNADTTLNSGGGALTVNGGTTLDGGLTHGTVIGSVPVGGINTVRIDVLPAGINMISPTVITIASLGASNLTAAGASTVTAGGVLALGGGAYIEYNTDENRFINTSAGNDFTDIKIGNIFPAHNGSAALRINGGGSGRGVQIDDGTTWNTQNINVTNTATINNLSVADVTAAELTTLTYVNIPESNTLPNDWDGGTTYDQYALVIYAPTNTLYFSLVAANQGNNPSSSPTFWLLANWDVATTYSIGYPTFNASTQTLWTSLQNSNTGNIPTTPPNWEVGTTYGNGAIVVYNALHYQSLQAANTGNLPNVVSSVWWVNIPIYWTPNMTSYNIGTTDTGLVFTPLVSGFTGITSLVKRLGDPDEELNVIVKNAQNVELSAQSVVVSPMYKDFDMGTQNITNLGSITGAGTLTLTAGVGLNVDIQSQLNMNNNDIINSGDITAAGSMTIDALGGSLVLNSSTGSVSLGADDQVVIASTTSYISLTAGAGQNVEINSPLDMNNNNIVGGNTITGTTALTLATLSNGNLNLSPNGTGLIEANKEIDMNNNNIVGGNTITGTGALTLATVGATNLNLSPDTGGLIVAGKGVNLSGNNITGGNTITGTGALTLATVGATNLNLSPDTGGLIVANKGVNLSGNNITNANTITGTTTLTLASTGNSNINISPAGTGQVIINKVVNFSSQTLFNMLLTNCDGIYGRPTGALVLVSQQAVNPTIQLRGAIQLWATSSVQAPGNSIAGLTTLTGQTTLGLATLSNGDLSLSPNGTGTIVANKALNMSGNPITNLTTLNGRNLFAYGNFYNDANQTLTATGTATRVKMNTSLNNNLITLDTTTNIGRITFTNAGVYHVVWNAYLLHGSGGTTKTRIWIRLNGTDVGGSGKTENNDAQQNETNLTSSSMVSVTASQYIEFYWAADGTNVPLTAVAASAPYPATPSFSCSVSIVG